MKKVVKEERKLNTMSMKMHLILFYFAKYKLPECYFEARIVLMFASAF